MLRHIEAKSEPSLFSGIYAHITNEIPELSSLIPKMKKLEKQLMADHKRGHLNDEKIRKITTMLDTAIKAVGELDINKVSSAVKVIDNTCNYKEVVCSKWKAVALGVSCFVGLVVYGLLCAVVPPALVAIAALPSANMALLTLIMTTIYNPGEMVARYKIGKIEKEMFAYLKAHGVELKNAKGGYEFLNNIKIKPKTLAEIVEKAAVILVQKNRINTKKSIFGNAGDMQFVDEANIKLLTQEDLATLFSEYLEATGKSIRDLDDDFVNKFVNYEMLSTKEATFISLKDVLGYEPEKFVKGALDSMQQTMDDVVRIHHAPVKVDKVFAEHKPGFFASKPQNNSQRPANTVFIHTDHSDKYKLKPVRRFA